MSQHKLAPKYILLTAPTLKHSRSTHINSVNTKSFEAEHKPLLSKLRESNEEKKSFKKSAIFGQQLDSVREELASCMQNTITQTKRNNILKELNSLLQRSNLEVEQRSKNQWKQRVQDDKKRLEKQEYQIEQILQKYNQEVARITTLREMADSARTGRVVYSALFKKIQWEIKHYQNLYRELIIKTQANKIAKSQKLTSVRQNKQSVDELQTKDQIAAKVCFKCEQSSKDPLFMTELSKIQARSTKKGNTQRIHQAQNKLSSLIGETQRKIDRIVKAAQCTDVEETIQWYTSLQKQNGKLMNLIEQEQFKIEEVQSQIARITEERRNSEFTEERHLTRLQSLSSNRKLRSQCNIKPQSEGKDETITDFVVKLTKVAGISISQDRPLSDVILELEQRLLRQQLVSGEFHSGSNIELGVESMLSKMERFENCQKIFSKRQFQGEYIRELSKQRKHQRTRK